MSRAFSVIVSTRNRARWLCDCLESLAEQTHPHEAFEIVVVDNGSSDDTKGVVEAFARRGDIATRYVYEARLGLSAARNTGVAASEGDRVVFLDDDAVAEPGWLAAYGRAFQDSAVVCAGGPIGLIWEKAPPRWLPPPAQRFLGRLDLGDEARPFRYPQSLPAGGNIAIRRSALDRYGGFDTALGVRGKRLGGAEESDLCYRVAADGGAIVYVPAAKVRHRCPPERVRPSHLLRRAWVQGRSAARMELKYWSAWSLVRTYVPYFLARGRSRREQAGPSVGGAQRTIGAVARLFGAALEVMLAAGYAWALIVHVVSGRARRLSG